MKYKFLALIFLMCAGISASAQVSGIKSASSGGRSRGSGERGGGMGIGGAYMFIDFAVRVWPFGRSTRLNAGEKFPTYFHSRYTDKSPFNHPPIMYLLRVFAATGEYS